MLHHWHQLHMGIAHLLDVGNQLRSYFTVIRICFLVFPYNGAQVQLVDTHGHISCLERFPSLQKFLILPPERTQLRNHGGGLRALLGGISVRVCLQVSEASLQLQLKFVDIPRLYIRYKKLKDAGIPETPHLVSPSVPTVEIPHHTGPHHIGGPHREISTGNPVDNHGMGSQFLIHGIVDSVLELLRVLPGDLGCKTVGLAPGIFFSVPSPDLVMVGRQTALFSGHKSRKEAVLVRHFHLHGSALFLKYDGSRFRPREIGLHHCLPPGFMGAQQLVGIVGF